MDKQNKNFIQKINNPKLYVLYSMLLTAITYLITLTSLNVLGYGNNTILQSDLAGQYISFLQMFKRLLQGKASLWYTFSEYLGSGAILTYAYYTLNPFNLLFLIPSTSPATITLVIILLKITLIGGCMELFLQKGLKLNHPATILFSLSYALNGFSVTLAYNLMWLDAIYMTPIIILLIMRYIKTQKWLAIVPAYAYLFITNFYMAYMVGIFSALVFVLYQLYLTDYTQKKTVILKSLFKSLIKYIAIVLLAVGLCACILLPCGFFLFSHAAPDNFSFGSLSSFLPEIINAFFVGQSGSLDNSLPFLYAGIPTLILSPLYFTNKNRPTRKKLFVGGLLLFYLLSMILLPLYEFMHAFDYPNYYAYRFSFIVIFILVAISAKEFTELSITKFKPLAIYNVTLIFLYSALIPSKALIRTGEQVNTSYYLVLNGVLLFLWSTIIYHSNRSTHKRIIFSIATILMIAELSFNGYLCEFKGQNLLSEKAYNAWIDIEGGGVSSVAPGPNEFYRIMIANDQQYNSGCYFGVPTYNTFSSSDDYNLRMILKNLGYATSNRCLESSGSTPVTNMLLGTKYIVEVPIDEEANITSPECTITENEYALSIGYMVKSNILDYKSVENPFENQLQLLYHLTGNIYDIYEPAKDLEILSENIDAILEDDYTVFKRQTNKIPEGRYYIFTTAKEDKTLYGAFPVESPECVIESPVVQGKRQGTNRYVFLSQGGIVSSDRITTAEGDTIDYLGIGFINSTQDYVCKNPLLVYYKENSINEAYNELSSNEFSITSFKDDEIRGTVVSSIEKPIMLTTIPYDKSWIATVDGMTTEIFPLVENAFCGIVLTPGEHDIVFKYCPQGYQFGKTISIASAILYCFFLLKYTLKRKKKYRHKK